MAYRVLHVVPAIAPRYGGPSVATLGMCRALNSIGEHTLVAATDADGPGRLAGTLGAVRQVDGVDVIMFARQATEAFKWSRPLARWLDRHVRDFDVVHIHAVFSHSSIAAGRACRAAGVPYVVRPLGTLDPWSLNHHAWRKRVLMAVGVRRLLAGAAAIHYTAEEERSLVESRLPFVPPGVVVPLAVSEELFARVPAAPHSDDRSRTVLVMARLDAKKGIDLLIDAFHAIEGRVKGTWTLVVAGDGAPAYVRELQERAARGPARDRISFFGWADEVARAGLLQSASLFVLPSQQENFGIAVVEALASGVPAIVSPGVNIGRDIEGAGAGWVSERTVPALAAALEGAMSDSAELARRAEAARRYADQFRWPAVAKGLVALYDRVTDRCAA